MTQLPPEDHKESLLKFPCDFPLKVFGLASDEFETAVLVIIRREIPTFSDQMIQSRLSENGKYKSLSITIHVESKDQLDRVYQGLSSSSQVLMVL